MYYCCDTISATALSSCVRRAAHASRKCQHGVLLLGRERVIRTEPKVVFRPQSVKRERHALLRAELFVELRSAFWLMLQDVGMLYCC